MLFSFWSHAVRSTCISTIIWANCLARWNNISFKYRMYSKRVTQIIIFLRWCTNRKLLVKSSLVSAFSRKGGTGGGGWGHPQSDLHMVAARLGFERAMVGTGWATSRPDHMDRFRKQLSFSQAGKTLRLDRSRLLPCNLETLLFLKTNWYVCVHVI